MRIFLLLFLTVAVHAAEITGKVVGVGDGDTITVLTAAKDSLKVRLYGIDAPESKQAFGNRAKQELSGMVFGRVVIVEVKQKDRYGRTVGLVTTSGVPVNQEMVRRGLAWWYRDYAKKDVQLAKAEAEAKSAKRGYGPRRRRCRLGSFGALRARATGPKTRQHRGKSRGPGIL